VSNGTCGVAEPSEAPKSVDEVIVPHLDAARRLARWLMRNEDEADDVVQEASLRALRYFKTFAGGNSRAWFLSVVRNTCRSWRRHGEHALSESFDEERHVDRSSRDPETLALQGDDLMLIERAMKSVPERFREFLVLRELEGLSYREIAEVMNIPMGTVMSSLSRARQAFRSALDNELKQSGTSRTARG
jgi:RNA polymerase sigma-70 factor (ECF subfamily)